jgi:hypothetical protein
MEREVGVGPGRDGVVVVKQAEGPLVMSAAASDVVAACRLFNFFLID